MNTDGMQSQLGLLPYTPGQDRADPSLDPRFFADLLAGVSAASNESELTQWLVEQFRTRVSFQRCTFAVRAGDERNFRAHTIYEERPDVPPLEATDIPVGTGVFCDWQPGDPAYLLLSETTRQDWRTYLVDPGLALDRLGSVIVIPLRTADRSRTIGIVALGTFGQHFEARAIELAGVLCAYLEIALDRFRTTEALGRSRDLYLTLFDEFPALIWRSGTDGQCDYFNKEWLRFTGRTPEQENGVGWLEGVHPDDVTSCLDGYMRKFARREPFLLEYRLRRHDGEYRWIYDYGRPFYNLDGQFSGYIGSCYDVTDRKRAEAQIRALADLGAALARTLDYDETLATIARLAVPELADWCIACIDFTVDRGEVRRLRISHRDHIKAQHTTAALEKCARDQAPPIVSSVMATGEATLHADIADESVVMFAAAPKCMRLVHRLQPRSAIAVPFNAHGRIVGALVLVSSDPKHHYGPGDLAFAKEFAASAALAVEKARLFGVARRSSELRDEVLRIVAHDLRSPLTSIRLGADMLREHMPRERDWEAAQKLVDMIIRSSDAASHLIKDLLDVTMIEAGILSVEKSPQVTADLLATVVEIHRPAAQAAGVTLSVTAARDLSPVLGDWHRLLQVFSNLIGNALKFTAPHGHVTIAADRSGEELVFSITDTGAGIPPDELPHVFDRYWKLHPTDRRGAGLGLAIVKGIVEAHGGRMWAESVLGQGSRFSFTLPRVVSSAELGAE